MVKRVTILDLFELLDEPHHDIVPPKYLQDVIEDLVSLRRR